MTAALALLVAVSPAERPGQRGETDSAVGRAAASAVLPPLSETVAATSLAQAALIGTATPPPAVADLRPSDHRVALLESSQPALQAIRLADDDVARYRRAFSLQADGAWDAADSEMARLRDRRLLGPLLRQRYLHHSSPRITYEALRGWLKRYGDQAGAERIYTLAMARQPRGAPPPPELPEQQRLSGALEEKATAGPGGIMPRSRLSLARSPEGPVTDRIEGYLRAGRLSAALRLLGDDLATRRLDQVAYDSLRARVAAALYYNGNTASALALAAASTARSGQHLPGAHWIAGLAAWREGDLAVAGRHFVAMAGNAALSPWQASAAAYWAARAEERLGHAAAAERWLGRAAGYDRTFYGLIARGRLGQTSVFQWQVPPLTVQHLKAIAATAPGWRALALLQVGQDDLAEQELRRIHPRDNALLAEALVALADAAGLPALALQIGNAVAAPDGGTFDAALYPLPHWTPPEGFTLDRALLFGIMRQESRFEPRLVSRAGATGIMQLMPETARDVARDVARELGTDQADDDDAMAGPGRRRLYDPLRNLSLGQRYVASLLSSPQIAGNLIHLAAAYNAGPSNLNRWRHDLAGIADPLLFIESLPMGETRDYIHKVLANTWIYQQRLGQPRPTLAALAAGDWPLYQPSAPQVTQVANRDDN